ncbi:MAG: hypothetical protein ABIS14_06560 [Sphingomonas sp.]
MALYRLVIEGTGIRTRKGETGFFTTRTVKQVSRDAAEIYALRVLREEWRHGVSAKLSPTKPQVRVIDCWRVGLRERLRRIPDTWHRFYEAGGRAEAARIEAAHADAPREAAIHAVAATAAPVE